MASVYRPGLASFITLRMPPQARGAYRSTGIVLAVLGAVQVGLIALTALMWGTLLMGGLLFGVFMGLTAGSIPEFPFSGGVALLPILVGSGFLFLYWNSWTYAKWVGRDRRAPTHARALGIITILGILTLPLRDPLSMLAVLAKVALAIALLVTSQASEAKAWFKPAHTAPPGWQPVVDA